MGFSGVAGFAMVLLGEAGDPNRLYVLQHAGINALLCGWFGSTLRGDRLTAPDRSGTMPIPWDFVAVAVTGLLVVGLGIAVIAIVNAP